MKTYTHTLTLETEQILQLGALINRNIVQLRRGMSECRTDSHLWTKLFSNMSENVALLALVKTAMNKGQEKPKPPITFGAATFFKV